MSRGRRIEQLAVPRDVCERPATRFVAGFIGGSSGDADERIPLDSEGPEEVRVRFASRVSGTAR
jgi:ABC-type Fe3+/spermidine/putrescine transport system ATPase subunit